MIPLSRQRKFFIRVVHTYIDPSIGLHVCISMAYLRTRHMYTSLPVETFNVHHKLRVFSISHNPNDVNIIENEMLINKQRVFR